MASGPAAYEWVLLALAALACCSQLSGCGSEADGEAAIAVVGPASCATFATACPDGKMLAYGDRDLMCAGDPCAPDDAKVCCAHRSTCDEFPGSCPAGQTLLSSGLCKGKNCTQDDSKLCCVKEQKKLAGVLKVDNMDYEGMERNNTVASHVCAVLEAQIGGLPDDGCVAVIICVTDDGCHGKTFVNLQFQLDISEKNESQVASIKEAIMSTEELSSRMDEQLSGADELGHRKNASENPFQVSFVAVEEGKVDSGHGGIYYPAVLENESEGAWTVKFAWGETMSGILTDNIRSIDSVDLAVGGEVDVLISMVHALRWHDKGHEAGKLIGAWSRRVPLDAGKGSGQWRGAVACCAAALCASLVATVACRGRRLAPSRASDEEEIASLRTEIPHF